MSCTCPTEPKVFRYLQLLQRDDLPIFITDDCGNPVQPERIGYTFYFCRGDGSRKQVGPLNRRPAIGIVGEYYATCHAGELDQAGCWVVHWEFQQTAGESIQTAELGFTVQDAVLANDPRDTLIRSYKVGWS